MAELNLRPSIEERMNQWLNDQADAAEIPDEQRQRFIDHMRGTSEFAAVRLSMTAADLWQDSRVPRSIQLFAMWLSRRLKGDDS